MILLLPLALLAAAQTTLHPRSAEMSSDQSAPLRPDAKADLARRIEARTACRRRYMGQDYIPQPAIWRLADADTTLYLFGTIHSLPLDFEWRTAQLDEIISEAHLLITETGLNSSGEDPIAKTNTAPQPPIADRIRGRPLAVWMGISALLSEERLDAINKMPTAYAALAIGMEIMLRRDPPRFTGVDHQLKQDFIRANKPVAAIEDSSAVTRIFSGMNERAQRRFLANALEGTFHPTTPAVRMESINHWARGDLLPSELTRSGRNVEFQRVLHQGLLESRNRAWVDAVMQRLAEPGTVLIAVGAGHLEGKGSLIELLAERGLKAERVSPTTTPRPRPFTVSMPASWRACEDYLFSKAEPPLNPR